jgi:hypothetical protein
MIAQYKILSRIALFIATYSLIIVAAVAFPNSHARGPGGPFGGGPGGSYNPSAKANVALFNLPAAISPPGNVTLRLVYQGFGILSSNPSSNTQVRKITLAMPRRVLTQPLARRQQNSLTSHNITPATAPQQFFHQFKTYKSLDRISSFPIPLRRPPMRLNS